MSTTTNDLVLNFWEGDEPTKTWTITDSDGTLDLTGSTVTIHWELTGGGGAGSGTATAVESGPSPAPRVRYTWAAGELDNAGTYNYEIRITDGGGNVTTLPEAPERAVMRVVSRSVS